MWLLILIMQLLCLSRIYKSKTVLLYFLIYNIVHKNGWSYYCTYVVVWLNNGIVVEYFGPSYWPPWVGDVWEIGSCAYAPGGVNGGWAPVCVCAFQQYRRCLKRISCNWYPQQCDPVLLFSTNNTRGLRLYTQTLARRGTTVKVYLYSLWKKTVAL